MSALPALSGKEVVQIFESFGWKAAGNPGGRILSRL